MVCGVNDVFNKIVNKVTCDLHVYGVFTDHNLFKYILCLNDHDFITPKKTKDTMPNLHFLKSSMFNV